MEKSTSAPAADRFGTGAAFPRSTAASRSRSAAPPWRKMLAFAGPGYLVAVGYMDPGNWATDIAGGARFGYTLLSVILLSNLMAILLQSLSARLGIASGRDLAQACRDGYSRRTTFVLWILCEIAIAACDLAEVLRRSHRPAAPVRPSADVGRVPDVARRAARALHAAQGLPLGRGDRHRADSRHRRMLCRRALDGPTRYGRHGAGTGAAHRDSQKSRRCSTSRSAFSARR